MNKKYLATLLTCTTLTLTTLTSITSDTKAQTNSPKNTIFVGIVRNDAGFLYRFSGGEAISAGQAKWDTCPQNTILVGRDFQSNGFWLCASPDIANKGTFYFGNVVKDRGYHWEVSNGKAKPVGDVKWDTCWEGTLRGRRFDSNGFWVCQP
ncbi:hypothetical protein [Geminocystis sp.]|uniref:hypothetical protein n=1 Tax=Geminocystis sp. TaxID=2664100 RepID=UPI0035935543